jgi:hypothetical protein
LKYRRGMYSILSQRCRRHRGARISVSYALSSRRKSRRWAENPAGLACSSRIHAFGQLTKLLTRRAPGGCQSVANSFLNGAGRGSSPSLDSFTAVQLARASLPQGGAGGDLMDKGQVLDKLAVLRQRLERLRVPRTNKKKKSGRPGVWKGHEGFLFVLAVNSIRWSAKKACQMRFAGPPAPLAHISSDRWCDARDGLS